VKKLLVLLISVLLLSACAQSEDGSILVIRTDKGKDIESLKNKNSFPMELTLTYYANEKYKYLTNDRSYIIEVSHGRYCPCYQVHETKKVDGGYKILNSKYEHFVIPKLKGFDNDYILPFTLNGPSGSIVGKFDSSEQFTDIIDTLGNEFDWDPSLIKKDK
jgi:hypothetical protein